MQVSQSSILICSIFLVSFAHIANGIFCFQCNSKEDAECSYLQKNDTHSKFYLPCDFQKPDEPPFCRKSILKVLMDYEAGPKQTRVIRSCGFRKDHKDRGCYKKADKDHDEEHCQCFQDGCNTASAHTVHTFLLIAPVTALFKFFFH